MARFEKAKREVGRQVANSFARETNMQRPVGNEEVELRQVRDLRVNVVVVNYHTADLVIASLARLEGKVHRVVIVDNSVSAAEFEKLQAGAADFAFATLLQMQANRGFGSGVNAGVDYIVSEDGTSNQALWILNPDASDESGHTVDSLCETLQQYPGAIVSPVILLPDRDTLWYAGGKIVPESGKYSHDYYLKSQAQLTADRPFRTEYMCGASIFCMAEVWQRLGGLREDLFMYCEDLELSMRAKALGIPLMIDPRAEVIHQVGASSQKQGSDGLSRLFYYYSARNRILVFLRPTEYGPRSEVRKIRFAMHTVQMALRPLWHESGVAKWTKSKDVVKGSLGGLILLRKVQSE
ncbi:glycosyltransferase family 2 protein [Gordonia amicalis]|uniref:glycosyltransferase family 2 protein n=1 Tax=Gordonia amicalis TaxID=89053 RepID=UPI0024BA36A8|nr:glycosyltransferase family 2 protein [Gordonia amicalis]MDJ0455357.1 glycosyltransferase family 2 protein [Gordonia amicalis]MDV7078807.1 glycosyltransferase family 2 protein [Gordonia amicalis]